MIRLDNISKQIGHQILFIEASAALQKGEKIGLVGPNGAGKTTLFRMITGQEQPDGGALRVGDTVQLAYVDQSRDALDDTITLTPTPGHSPCHCCVNILSRGQRAVVTGDMMHHAIQCREPDWSARPDWDARQSAASRRKFLSAVADTDTLLLPIHFPTPTAGLVTADGDRFNYRFKRD